MSDYSTTVILSPGGTAREEVKLSDIHIPDLWHLGQGLIKDGRKRSGENVLTVWHLAHDLKRNLAEDTDPR